MRFAVEVFSTTIEVILDGEPLSAGSFSAMTDAWRWCRASPAFAPVAVIRARVDPAREPGGQPVDCDIVARDVAELGERLSAAITHAAIEAAAGRFQLFHAAGVAHRQSGASAALIGPSGAGKSTAVLALGRQFDYLTDETVAVDRAGVVQPYRKPVSLRVGGEPWKRQLDPASVGLTRGAAARPVLRRLIVLDRRSGPTDVEVRPLGPIEAIERVLPETSHVGRLPGALTAIKRLADQCGGFVSVSYRDVDDLCAVVSDLLESETYPVLRRAHVDDAIDVGGATLLLRGRTYTRLDARGSAAWALLAEPRPLDDVIRALSELTGLISSDDVADPSAVVEQLLASGVIEHASAALAPGGSR